MEDTIREVLGYLLQAEETMLKGIATPTQLRDKGFVNYGQLNECLELAHAIGALRKRAQSVIDRERPAKASNATDGNVQHAARRESANIRLSAISGPEPDCVFFIEGDVLYKYARGARGDGSVYRRAVHLDYVYRICKVVSSILDHGDYVTVQEIMKMSGMKPPYRIQVTLGALVEAHVLKAVGRGRYALDAPRSLGLDGWIEELKSLPRRQEWAKAYRERGEA